MSIHEVIQRIAQPGMEQRIQRQSIQVVTRILALACLLLALLLPTLHVGDAIMLPSTGQWVLVVMAVVFGGLSCVAHRHPRTIGVITAGAVMGLMFTTMSPHMLVYETEAVYLIPIAILAVVGGSRIIPPLTILLLGGLGVVSVTLQGGTYPFATMLVVVVITSMVWVVMRGLETAIQQTRALRALTEQRLAQQQRFVAQMSHEFRSPLHVILNSLAFISEDMHELVVGTGAAESLPEDPLTTKDDARHWIHTADEHARQLVTLIDTMLDFTKVELGALTITPEPLDLRDVVSAAFATLHGLVQPHPQIMPYLEIDDLTPLAVADPVRVRQILINLVANAVKFTTAGSITIALHADPRDDSRVCVEVVDTGHGIPADQIEAVFLAYYQIPGDDECPYGGAGLGLPLSRRLAEAQGGWLRCTSVVGEGSTFTLSLPRSDRRRI